MYSLFHTPRYYASSGCIKLSNSLKSVRLAEIAWFKSRLVDIYRRNLRNKSLTRQEYELASQLFSMIKERSKLDESYIDVLWREIQEWEVQDVLRKRANI